MSTLTEYPTDRRGPWWRTLAFRKWMLVGYWGVCFFITHWPKLGGIEPPSWYEFPHNDKVIHACLYAGGIVLAWWVVAAGGRRVRPSLAVGLVVVGACYAVFDEITQIPVQREPSVLDFAADLAGMVLATVLLLWRQARRHRREKA